jgi:hypothetical protein
VVDAELADNSTTIVMMMIRRLYSRKRDERDPKPIVMLRLQLMLVGDHNVTVGIDRVSKT